MKTVREFLAHPLIRMALVLGAITIILAYFSKRVFAEPLSDGELGLPAFLGALFQGYAKTKPASRFSRTWIGLVIVTAAAGLVLALNA